MRNYIKIIFIISFIAWGLTAQADPSRQDIIPLAPLEDNPQITSIDKINKTMEVKNPDGYLSGNSFICGNTAYVKIFSGLSTIDVTSFWNDIIVLNSMGIKHIELYLNSPGGDAFTGLSLADQIIRAQNKYGFTIVGNASGIVASAAVPVLAVCSKRLATSDTIFMVHEASLWKWPGRETASDIRSQNDLMSLLKERYINKLVSNSKLTKEQWQKMEQQTTWFSATQALEWQLIDAIE